MNSEGNTSLLPYTPDDADDDGRMVGGIEVSYRELEDDEIEAIRQRARDRVIEEGGDGFRWGRCTFDLPPIKLAGVLSREPRTEYAYEKVGGMFDVGTRRVVFEEQIDLTSGDDGLLEISIETEEADAVETITVNTHGGTTWAGSP